MMGLVPATDFVESLLLRLVYCRTPNSRVTVAYAGLGDGSPRDTDGERLMKQEGGHEPVRWIFHTIAVIIVAATFLGVVTLFFVLIYVSALHMQQGWSHYQDGLGNVLNSVKKIVGKLARSDLLPPGIIDHMSAKALTGLEDILSAGLSFILENVTSSISGGLMMLLYMMFWLCQPMQIGQQTSGIFKHYILLKSLASVGYASCVWLLLHLLNIDLAVVFGLITFLFNFVPEVGPFLAMVLPVPIVLFDGRLKSPMVSLAMLLSGNMLLKCLWGNIIEVKIVESQQELKMHPVVILFFVAFFGYIWGPTGMLLSVPAVAVIKASMHLIPEEYRNPMLILLEGDQEAPANYERMRSESVYMYSAKH